MTLDQNIISEQVDFRGGINTKTDPTLLQGQTPDSANFLFDEEVGMFVKRKGIRRITTLPSGNAAVKMFTYVKHNGDTILLVQDTLGNIYHTRDLRSYILLHRFSTPSIVNFAVFEDLVWLVNGQDTPIVWDGISAAPLIMAGSDPAVGGGIDYDGFPRADLRGVGGTFIFVHQERLFIANTINNQSEIIYSRFFDSDGALIKATRGNRVDGARTIIGAWVSSNQIVVNTNDGYVITAALVFLGNIIVVKEKAFYIIRGNPPDFSITKLPFEITALFNDTFKIVNNVLYFLGHNGIYSFTGTVFSFVSEFTEKLFDGAKQFLGRLVRRNITSETDFRAGATISNIATMGYASGTLRLPQVLTNPFGLGTGATAGSLTDTVVGTDGFLRLTAPVSVETSIGHTTVFESAEGFVGNMIDGNATTFYGAKTSDNKPLGSSTPNTGSRLNTNLVFSRRVYVSSITIKYEGIQDGLGDSQRTILSVDFYDGETIVARFNVPNTSHGVFNFSSGVGRFATKVNIDVRASGQDNDKGWFDTRSVWISSRLYEVSVKTVVGHNTPGTFISREFDTGCGAGEFDWRHFQADHTLNGGTITYEIGSYDHTGTAWDSIPAAQRQTILAGHIPTIPPRRFYRVRIVLTAQTSNPFNTPVVRSFRVDFANTGVWTGQPLFIGQVGGWGSFLVDSLEDTNIVYERRVGNSLALMNAAPFTRISPGAIFSDVVGDDIHTQLRTTLTRQEATARGPVVNALSIVYMVSGEILQNATAIVHKNKYYLSLTKGERSNDTIIVHSPVGVTTQFTGLNISCFTDFRDKILGGSSTPERPFVYELFNKDFTDDDGLPIRAHLQTKEIIGSQPLLDMILREIYLHANTDKDAEIEVDIYADGRYYDTVTFEISNKEIDPKRRMLTNGVKGKRFHFVMKNAIKGDEIKARGITAIFKPIRISV